MMSNTGSHSCYGLQPASTALEDLLVTYVFLPDQITGLPVTGVPWEGWSSRWLPLPLEAHRILQSLFSVRATDDHPCFWS